MTEHQTVPRKRATQRPGGSSQARSRRKPGDPTELLLKHSVKREHLAPEVVDQLADFEARIAALEP